jgi:hypothetical protein
MPGRKPRAVTTPPAGRGTADARRKAAAFRAAEAARTRRRRLARWAAVAATVVVAVAAVAIAVLVSGHHGSGTGRAPAARAGAPDAATATLTGPPGPEGIVLEQAALLAPLRGAATGSTVDGVQCNTSEQVAYHIHTHLTVYVNGALRAVPPGIGVVQPVAQRTADGVFDQASRCYYWLHTHAQDGIIHVEAPTQKTYTLGQFFAIWRQPLTGDQVGPARGTVTAYVNGRRFAGDPASIPLVSHEDVQFDVGPPGVAPKKVDWSHAQL